MFVKAVLLVPLLLASLIFVKGNRSGKKKGPGRCPRKIIVTSGHTGTIKTPGYPQFYKIRQICLWRIKVPPGYGVHLDFHDKFGVDCTSKDRVAVSSRRLFFKPKPSGSKTTAILCGTSQISNVTVPDRDMWVRFQAHRKETRGIGFKATYRSLDNDECESRHGCQQNCINTPGSYRCSCNSGYQLAKNGYNCTVIPKYEVKFERDSYVIPVSQGIPKNTRVLKARAYVKGQNKRIRYSIKGRYPKPHILKKYPFYISPDSGEITSSRRLPAGIFEYRMTVKAEVNSKSHAKATVVFNVSTASPNIKRVKFSSPRYSVIIADNLKRGDTVLNLSISPATALHYLIYNISERNRFFLVSKDLGSLKVKRDLSELKLSKNSSRRFLFTIVARHRERTVVAASVVVTVIVIPAHSGDIYGKLAPTKEIDFSSGKARKKPKRSEFAFHRFFRQLSPIAQDISKAERKFDKDIRSIRESVVEAYTDRRLRSSGPVIANLPPISLASRDKLQELINASHCVIPKADCSNVTYHSQYRTFDGTCNNLKNPLWGAANMPFSRIIPAKYWDTEGRGEPVGFPDQEMVPNMPSPHLVSKEYVLHRTSTARNDNAFSHMMMQWGQFLDHDITFTAESEGSELCATPRCDGSRGDFESPCYPIMYPDSRECTMFTRSAAACQTDPINIKNREQLNVITSYIDGSQVYGSSLKQATSLRDHTQNLGYLAMNHTDYQYLLPEMKDTLNPPLNLCLFSGGCFAAGDLRANEQVVLASMHTMWAREHNRLATFLKYVNPHWDSDRLFQEARKIVIAELQHITFQEYLTKFLGKDAIPPYSGYKEDVDATIFNSFATSAFRAGHSMVRPAFSRLDENYDPIGPDVPLVDAFFNNKLIHNDGIEPFILGLLGNVSETINRGMASGLTKHLFQQKGSQHGFDLAALNIQRGRDHGLPGYGSWRRECRLGEAVVFDETQFEINSAKAREILTQLYHIVEHSDLWVAGLAEDHVAGAMVGPTFLCILKRQFERLRDGDRFWYENPEVFSPEQLKEIKKVTLSRVICDNVAGVVSVQKDAFLAATKETQRVQCRSGLSAMNISKWKEDPLKDLNVQSEKQDKWGDWIKTIRTATGSWGTLEGVCGNHSVAKIECQTRNGNMADNAGESITCNKDIGFYCRHIEQEGRKKCSGYKFRVTCSQAVNEGGERRLRPKATGLPSQDVADTYKCDASFSQQYYQVTEISASAVKEITLFSKFQSYPGLEFLYLGRYKKDARHRFLIQFDLGRVSRRSILLSATLRLFLVSADKADEDLRHSLEVYPITSTDWHEKNVTVTVPWNEDFLGIGSDVDKDSRKASKVIHSNDKEQWIGIDVFKHVFNWRISRKRRANFGFLVKLANEGQADSLLRFASNAHKNKSIRPSVFICLNNPPW